MSGFTAPGASAALAVDAAPFKERSIEHHEIVWEGVRLRIVFTPYRVPPDDDLIELDTVDPTQTIPWSQFSYKEFSIPAMKLSGLADPSRMSCACSIAFPSEQSLCVKSK